MLGPSGCGKSTALNCIAGLLALTSGEIRLGGTRIDQLEPERRGFGMVFQSYALFPHMSVRKNVGFGLAMQGIRGPEADQRIRNALALVRLESQADKLPGQLSGGQQQRVAIARAIVIRPPIVLMDEPLSNLDAKLRLEMRAEIRGIHDQIGSTTIYVTHDQDEALSLADRIVVMSQGHIEQIGSPQDLYQRPVNVDVADFMGFRDRVVEGRITRVTGAEAEIEVAGAAPRWHDAFAVERRRCRLYCRCARKICCVERRRHCRHRRSTEYRGRAFFGSARWGRLWNSISGRTMRWRGEHRPACNRSPDGRWFSSEPAMSGPSLKTRLAARGLDGTTLLVLPGLFFMIALLYLSVRLRRRGFADAERWRCLVRKLREVLLAIRSNIGTIASDNVAGTACNGR